MASPNFQASSDSQPYTLQTDITATSIAALFTTMSDFGNNPPTPTLSAGDNPAASLLSKVSSKSSAAAASTAPSTNTNANSNTNSNSNPSSFVTSTTTGAGATSAAAAASSTNASSGASIASSSLQSGTSTAPSEQSTGGAGASGTATGTNPSGSTSSAAANDGSPVAKSTSGGGMSTGTKAAIAVPIVVIALAILVLAILCIRRRKRKREEKGEPAEKVPLATRKKNWTRHLRIFSFDTELLMGGRFSSTNSIRTRETGSMRSGVSSQNSQTPSVHTVDEVAPPYRDAVSTAQPLSIGQVMAGAAAVGVGRSASNATANTAGTMGTAPPPYGAGASRAETPATPVTPSTIGRRNPFSDSAPVSPVEVSPFNDPLNQSPAISRNSSLYHNERDDTSTIGGASEAASIREATLARNASVMSGGRIINNVNKT